MNTYRISVPVFHFNTSDYILSTHVYVKTSNINQFLDDIVGSGPHAKFEQVLTKVIRVLETEVEKKIGAQEGSFKGKFEYSFPIGETTILYVDDIAPSDYAFYLDSTVYEESDKEDE